MFFELMQTLSLNGTIGKANDDRAGTSAHHAWVVDGATDLGPSGLLGSETGAAWLASAANTGFFLHRGADLKETCQKVFNHVAARFEADQHRPAEAAWELPNAAFAAVQLIGGRMDIAWAADCSVLWASADTYAWCTPVPNPTAEIADALALGAGTGAAALSRPDILADRRAQRAAPDRTVLTPDPVASSRGTSYASRAVNPGDDIILMSDGVSDLIAAYQAHDEAGFVAKMRAEGLAALYDDLRRIERADAACLKFPRFKISDDATAIWLRVAD